jgi:ketosteroid isomerase-like protein
MATVTIPTLRRAIEARDGETLASLYADDAVLRIVDQEHPPSRPNEINGRDAIAAYYADVCGRTMTHRVDAAVADGDRLAFTQTCTYPDGKRVCFATMLELVGGTIVRQTAIQAWDA